MQTFENTPVSAEGVNYDDSPIAELEVSGVAYRLDAGRGSAVAVSQREPGTWDWTPVTEGRWDGSRLRAKGLDSEVVMALALALREAMRTYDGER